MTKRNNSIEEMANQAECPDPKKLVAPFDVTSWNQYLIWMKWIRRASRWYLPI